MGLLAALVGILSVEIALGLCRDLNYAIRDHDEDREDHVDGMPLSYHRDPAMRDEPGAHLVSENLSILNLRSELVNGHCGLEHPSAVQHGWYVSEGWGASPSDRPVGRQLRVDRLVRKGSAVEFDWRQPQLLARAELIQHSAYQNGKTVLVPHSHLEYENASEANCCRQPLVVAKDCAEVRCAEQRLSGGCRTAWSHYMQAEAIRDETLGVIPAVVPGFGRDGIVAFAASYHEDHVYYLAIARWSSR